MSNKTRRDLLKAGLCTAAAGAVVASGIGVLKPAAAKAETAMHPYGYPIDGLDVETTRQLGYNGYKGIVLADGKKHKDCAFATFNGIISQLADKVGYPYDGIPTQMMEWASGGVAGYATFCGALNGASAAIGLICDNSNAKAIISDLLNWYSESPLPSNKIAPTGSLPQSVSGSNLCHTSVTNWCDESGYASGSAERSERCARLAGDVIARVVEMLNGSVVLTGAVPRDKTVCGQCHYKGPDYDAGQFTRGKMDCTTCHGDLDQVPEGGHGDHEHDD